MMTKRRTRYWEFYQLLVVFIILLFATTLSIQADNAASGRTYYVDANNGSNNNSGLSPDDAWRGTRHALRASLQPGDSVLFRRGQVFRDEEAVIGSSGTASAPITIGAYGNGSAPNLQNPNPGTFRTAVRIDGDHVVIRDLLISNTNEHGILIYGDHVIVENNELTDVGMAVRIKGNYTLVRNNYIHDLRMIVNDTRWDNDYGVMAVVVNRGTGARITNNRFINLIEDSYDYGKDGAAFEIYAEDTVTDVYFSENYIENCDNFFEVGSYTVREARNIYLNHNVINGCRGLAAIHVAGGGSQYSVDIRNLYIENNTIFESKALWLSRAPAPNEMFLRNNIFIMGNVNGFNHDGRYERAYNLYYAPNIGNGNGLGYTLDPTEMIGDPKLGPDFIPSPDSPAVNAGYSAVAYSKDYIGTTLPQGPALDIGALEFNFGTASGSFDPIANAGDDQSIIDVDSDGQELVMLDASRSYDIDSSIIGYAWQRNGAVIATSATAQVSLPVGEHTIGLTVTDEDGNQSAMDELFISIKGGIVQGRISAGLRALYTFEENGGGTVTDVSNVGAPLNLSIGNPDAVTWGQGSLTLDQPTGIASSSAADKISSPMISSDTLTLEAWIAPSQLSQAGPARIVTISADSGTRNVTLGHGLGGNTSAAVYDARIRTTTTTENGTPSLTTAEGTTVNSPTHVVVTYSGDAISRIYINGQLMESQWVGGDFDNWNSNFRLGLGDELDGDRAWLGTFYLVAFYDRALDEVEVLSNFLAGPGTPTSAQPIDVGGPSTQPPVIEDTPTQTYTVGDDVSLQVVADDPDSDDLGYAATELPTGLSIDAATGLITGQPTTAGQYNSVVTVTDADEHSASVQIAWTIDPAPVEPEPTVEEPVPTDAPVEPTAEEPAPTDAPVEPTAEEPAPTDAPVEPTAEEPAPTDVVTVPTSAVTVEVRITQLLDQQADFQIKLYNDGDAALSDLSYHLYFTPDNGKAATDYRLPTFWAPSGDVVATGPLDAGNGQHYFVVDFNGVTLQPGENWRYAGGLQMADWSPNMEVDNDWWQTTSGSNFTETSYIPVYTGNTWLVGQAPTGGSTEPEPQPTEPTPEPNTAPLVVNDVATMIEGEALLLQPLSNDSDPDGDPLTLIDVEDPANGSVVQNGDDVLYTVDPGFVGLDTIIYTVSDGEATATGTIDILVEAAPTPEPDFPPTMTAVPNQVTLVGEAVSLQVQAFDPDGGALIYDALGLPAGLSIDAATGLISGAPTAASDTVVTLSVLADDGDQTVIGFNWVVMAPNLPPTIDAIADQNNETGQAVSLQVVANDPDGSALIFNAEGLPAGVVIDAATGLISGAPTAASNTSVTVRVFAQDGDEAETSFDWAVSVPDAPPPTPEPTDEPPTPASQLRVELRLTQLLDQQADFNIRLHNDGDTPVNDVSYRFYFTPDNGRVAADYALKVWWSPLSGVVTDGPFDADTDNPYFTMAFTTNTLQPGANWNIAGGLQMVRWTPDMDIDNDWWMTVAESAFTQTDYMPVYVAGELAAGQQPGSAASEPVPAALVMEPITDQVTDAGASASLQVQVTNPAGGALRYGAQGLPNGLAIDAATGAITGSPDAAGAYTVIVSAVAADGASTEQSFIWTVNDDSTPEPGEQRPAISAIPDQVSRVGDSVNIQVQATDPQGDAVTFSGIFPLGISIDPTTGVISGTLEREEVHNSIVTARDSSGNEQFGNFIWTVNPAPNTPAPQPTQVPTEAPTEAPTQAPAPNADLSIQIETQTVNNQQAQFNYRVTNNGNEAVSNIAIRIYYAPDNGRSARDYVLARYWDQSRASSIGGPINVDGTLHYYEINYGSAELRPGQTWQFNGSLHINNWRTDFDASNDWWLGTQSASFTPTDRLPIYVNGALVTGSQP